MQINVKEKLFLNFNCAPRYEDALGGVEV